MGASGGRIQVEVGQRFVDLEVIEIDLRLPPTPRTNRPTGKVGERAVRVRCKCGTEVVMKLTNLTSEKSQVISCRKCACEHTSRPGKDSTSVLYNLWSNIKKRCLNPNNRNYHYYGGRGISIDSRWMDFETFKADIERDLGPRPANHSLDRIDNDGDYRPGNVRWATQSQQLLNRRDLIDADLLARVQRLLDEGKSRHTVSRITGMPASTIYLRFPINH